VCVWCVCFCVFLPSLSSMQWACAVLRCHLWPVWLYHIFHTFPHIRYGFRKEVIEHKTCILTFSISFVRNFCHSENNSVRYFRKYTKVFIPLYVPALMKIEFSCQIFDEISNITFHENQSNVRPPVSTLWDRPVVRYGRKDRQTWRKSSNVCPKTGDFAGKLWSVIEWTRRIRKPKVINANFS
jgi:hypothetical protein